MDILNDNTQNYPFFREQLVVETLNTQLNVPTYVNSIKVPKRNYKTLVTSVIKSPMTPPSLLHTYSIHMCKLSSHRFINKYSLSISNNIYKSHLTYVRGGSAQSR